MNRLEQATYRSGMNILNSETIMNNSIEMFRKYPELGRDGSDCLEQLKYF